VKDIQHTKFAQKMMMLSNPQSFSKDVSRLHSGAKIRRANEIRLHFFSNEVAINVYVLHAFMKDWILGYLYS